MQWNAKIVVLGAGDRGTASAIRVYRAGLRPLLLESSNPSDLHYFRNFSDLVYCGTKQVDDINGRYLGNMDNSAAFDPESIRFAFNDRNIPLVSGTISEVLDQLKPEIVIDCRENDPEPSLLWHEYPYVVKIGIQYNVGIDGHVIIGEGRRDQGRVYYKRHNQTTDQVDLRDAVKAPIEGVFVAALSAGEPVKERQNIGMINEINILSPQNGYIAGILHSGHFVARHQFLVEIQTAGSFYPEIREIPPKSVAISGGVLEAVMAYLKKVSPATW